MAAFRRGVQRNLGDLPGAVEVIEPAAGHNMVAEQPGELTELIIRFLAGSAKG